MLLWELLLQEDGLAFEVEHVLPELLLVLDRLLEEVLELEPVLP